MMRNRYYVQSLAQEVFLIRECLSPEVKPGPDDPIIRSCTIRHDAELHADALNKKQRKQNEQSLELPGTLESSS